MVRSSVSTPMMLPTLQSRRKSQPAYLPTTLLPRRSIPSRSNIPKLKPIRHARLARDRSSSCPVISPNTRLLKLKRLHKSAIKRPWPKWIGVRWSKIIFLVLHFKRWWAGVQKFRDQRLAKHKAEAELSAVRVLVRSYLHLRIMRITTSEGLCVGSWDFFSNVRSYQAEENGSGAHHQLCEAVQVHAGHGPGEVGGPAD